MCLHDFVLLFDLNFTILHLFFPFCLNLYLYFFLGFSGFFFGSFLSLFSFGLSFGFGLGFGFGFGFEHFGFIETSFAAV